MKNPAQTPNVFCEVFKGSAAVFLILSSSLAYAFESSPLTPPADVRRQAVYYRNQGLELQNTGNLDGAMSSYKMAVETDPTYALAYNDMGVVNEARGMYKQAEQDYLKAVEVDPSLAGAYSNLALLKEEQRDLDKAKEYWKKRAELGDPSDPWTVKAKEKVYGFGSSSYSLDNDSGSVKDELVSQARFYREEGMKMQTMGNLTEALANYMKAQQLDPAYGTVYNDIGVIYETQGQLKIAEGYYLKAIDVDPAIPGSYSNLALLNENNRDLKQALYYWKKRQSLGDPADPWTETARRRVRDIRMVIGDSDARDASEDDIMSLVGSVAQSKEQSRKDNAELSRQTFSAAKKRYESGDDVTALKKAIDAGQLDPENEEISRFTEQVERRLLSK